MKESLTFNLTRPALKSGGDRYEAEVGEPKPMVVYIPQKFSRQSNTVAKVIKVTLED